jgi:hypothetical protein
MCPLQDRAIGPEIQEEAKDLTIWIEAERATLFTLVMRGPEDWCAGIKNRIAVRRAAVAGVQLLADQWAQFARGERLEVPSLLRVARVR